MTPLSYRSRVIAINSFCAAPRGSARLDRQAGGHGAGAACEANCGGALFGNPLDTLHGAIDAHLQVRPHSYHQQELHPPGKWAQSRFWRAAFLTTLYALHDAVDGNIQVPLTFYFCFAWMIGTRQIVTGHSSLLAALHGAH